MRSVSRVKLILRAPKKIILAIFAPPHLPQNMDNQVLKTCMDGFIYSGGEIVALSSPTFQLTVNREFESAASNVDRKTIPHWFRKAKVSKSAQHETRVKVTKAGASVSKGKTRNYVDEEPSHGGRDKRVILDVKHRKIPDTKTRNRWLKNHYPSFLAWKQNGENEDQRPRYDVSTWTAESVFKFFEFYWNKSARSRAKVSTDFTDSTESVECEEFKKSRRLRFLKSKQFVSLFEKKRSSVKKKGRGDESQPEESDSDDDEHGSGIKKGNESRPEKSDSDDEEHGSGMKKRSSAKRKGNQSRHEESDSDDDEHYRGMKKTSTQQQDGAAQSDAAEHWQHKPNR